MKTHKKYSEEILSSCLFRIGSELDRNEDLRSKNRNIALAVSGAIISFSLTQSDYPVVFIANVLAFSVALVCWIQDYQFHKYRHGWHGVDTRLRKYIKGSIDEKELDLMQYHSKDEKYKVGEDGVIRKAAKIFSKSSSFTFIILLLGALVVIIFRWFYPLKS